MSAASIVPVQRAGLRVPGQPETPPRHPEPVAALADRLAPRCTGVVDVDELVALIEATGVNDRVAQRRYQMASVFELGEAMLGYLRQHRPEQLHRARPAAHRVPFIRTAVVRCGLYVTPVAMVAAAGGPLDRVRWTVAAGALVTGWSGGQGLAYLGHVVAARAGQRRAAQVLLLGFGALALAWSAVLTVAPVGVAGPDRLPAQGVSLAELTLFAAVAAALVTGAEAVVLLWTTPSWLVAGVVLGGLWPQWWVVQPAPVLLGGIALIAGRAFWPALRWPRRGGQAGAASPSPGRRRLPVEWTELGRAIAYLMVGLGQSTAFVLVWRSSPEVGDGGLPPATIPLLLAVPVTEILVGWHVTRASVGLDQYDDRHAHRRHARRLGTLTLAALVPPLIGGAALAGVADRLPYSLYGYPAVRNLVLYAYPNIRDLVLAVAGGILLAGVFAMVLLLTARRRVVTAAVLACCPTALAVLLAARPTWAGVPAMPTGWSVDMLPGTVIALVLVHVAGLVLAARAVLDTESYR